MAGQAAIYPPRETSFGKDRSDCKGQRGNAKRERGLAEYYSISRQAYNYSTGGGKGYAPRD